jgi:Amt family ammonium transporter
MLAGYALVCIGFGKARGAAYAGLSAIVVISIAMLTFWAVGHPAVAAVTHWIRHSNAAITGTSISSLDRSGLSVMFQLYAVSFAAMIPLGAAADRWRLRSLCFSAFLFAALSFPLFVHWSWDGGWLSSAAFLGGGSLFDPGGAASIHVLGALTALAIAWILGPRRKKYPTDGPPAAIPGHNMAYVLVGCLLLSPGWIALNCAGAALYGVPAAALLAVAVNTQLCAGASLLSTLVTTRVRYIKPDASLCANGWVGGLVASSAICCVTSPWLAIFSGLLAGWLVTLFAEWVEVVARVDDPCGVISVHGVSGICGLVLAGIFPRLNTPTLAGGGWTFSHNLLPQLVGISTLLGIMFPLSYGLNWTLNFFARQRVELSNERKGMDLHELGGIAYPEFSLQPDD